MDVLFIVGPSKTNNADLRLALRSLAKHARGVGRVMAAGYLPDWLSDEVEKFPHVDLDVPGKWKSIITRIVDATLHFDLHGDFVCASDDIFFTADVDLDAYPRYVSHSAMPRTVSANKRNKSFWTALVETRAFLRDNGFPALNFMTHAHQLYDADSIRRNEKLIRSTATKLTKGAEGLCLLNNIALRERALAIAFRNDCKMGENFNEADALDPENKGQFSISDKALETPAFKAWAEREFPNPCKYEA